MLQPETFVWQTWIRMVIRISLLAIWAASSQTIMTEDCGTPPGPGPEHQTLKEAVGTWNVDCTFYMDPSQPPMVCEAKETIEMLGEFFTVSLFEADFGGMDFKGRATLGFDPERKKFTGTWIDSMSPHMFPYEGDYDAATKTLEMSGQGYMCQFGGNTPYRMTEKALDGGGREFEMFATPAGMPEIKLFTYVYSRAD